MMKDQINRLTHLKKLGRHGQLVFWLVDGSRVRQEIDEDFTNFGQHYRFPFIPEYECWLDREAVPGERKFFIDHLLTEWRLQRRGCNYRQALALADAKERAERHKSGYIKKISKNGKLNAKRAHGRLLKKVGVLSVWLVNGRLVRDVYDIDFTEGGHDLVYHYIPSNEIWIDNDVITSERMAVVFHELYERDLMARGCSYTRAHNFTLKKEWEFRHDKKSLFNELYKLGWRK